MKFTVKTSSEAERNIVSAFGYISQDAPGNAASWLIGIYKAIDTLDTFPSRCPIAQDQPHFPHKKLRQLLFKSHRIIFQMDEAQKMVHVLYVRHAKMRPVGDLKANDD